MSGGTIQLDTNRSKEKIGSVVRACTGVPRWGTRGPLAGPGAGSSGGKARFAPARHHAVAGSTRRSGEWGTGVRVSAGRLPHTFFICQAGGSTFNLSDTGMSQTNLRISQPTQRNTSAQRWHTKEKGPPSRKRPLPRCYCHPIIRGGGRLFNDRVQPGCSAATVSSKPTSARRGMSRVRFAPNRTK